MPKYDFSKERAETNESLALEIAALTTLTAAEVARLLPTKRDKKQLQELIEIVNSGASQNRKIASLRSNLTELGGVMLKVLKRVVI